MVKRTPTRGAVQQRNDRRSRHGVQIQLMMECVEEGLSDVQKSTYATLQKQYNQAMNRIAEANALARAGKAVIVMHNDPSKPIPPPPVSLIQQPPPSRQVAANVTNRQAGQPQNAIRQPPHQQPTTSRQPTQQQGRPSNPPGREGVKLKYV